MPTIETATAVTTKPRDKGQGSLLAEQRLLFHHLSWAAYRQVSEALAGTAARLAFDRGSLEIMTTSRLHEMLSRCLATLITVLAEEMDLPLDSSGRMTCDREDQERGVEADESFYITHEPDVRGKMEIDLQTDPPPDLAIEVDISRSSRVRLPVYAALGVPEVWRWDGEQLTFLHLGPAGRYAEVTQSLYFPGVAPTDVRPFLLQRMQADDISVMRAFRVWLRQRLGKPV